MVYGGRLLQVDWARDRSRNYHVSDRRQGAVSRRQVSFRQRFLWDTPICGVDPLSPENVLIVMTAPLTGTGAPCTSRFDISAKSPLDRRESVIQTGRRQFPESTSNGADTTACLSAGARQNRCIWPLTKRSFR
jgi:aldehyde:ferredoxin oxidoreductase